MVRLRTDEVSDPTTKINRQVGSVGTHNDLLMGVPTEVPRGCKVRNHLRFAMAGGDIHHYTLFLASFNLLEDSGKFLVVWAYFVARIDMLDEV